jgi:hypothetical protein
MFHNCLLPQIRGENITTRRNAGFVLLECVKPTVEAKAIEKEEIEFVADVDIPFCPARQNVTRPLTNGDMRP